MNPNLSSLSISCSLKAVKIEPDPGVDFSTAISSSIQELVTAFQRGCIFDDNSGKCTILNDHTLPDEGCPLTGSLFTYTENQLKNAVLVDKKALKYEIKQLAPPIGKDGKDKMEFIDNYMWFAVRGDYIAFSTSKGIPVPIIQKYFSWLFSKALKDKCGRSSSYCVKLSPLQRPALKSVDMKDVESIALMGNTSSIRNRNGLGQKQHFEISRSVVNSLLKICRQPLPENPDDEYNDSALDVDINIKSSRKDSAPAKRHLLTVLAEALRDAEDTSVVFKFSDGRVLNAKELKIDGNFTVKTKNGLPDAVEVVERLSTWLLESVENLENPRAVHVEPHYIQGRLFE